MTNRLTPVRLAAAKAVHSGDNMALSQLQELPLAAQQISNFGLPLVCERTGIIIGHLTVLNVAGKNPLIKQWNNTQFLHPIFSISLSGLLKLGRNTWLRFCAFSAEEIADSKAVEKQEEQLRIIALALLHHMTDIKQDIPWMPELADVIDQWTSLIALCYWQLYLESDRFKFPGLRISQREKCIDLKGYLQACWKKKKEYETVVSEHADREERDKVAAAEKALFALRNDIAGKKPRSPKLLWRWFNHNMPKRYSKDIAGWMQEIYFADESDLQKLQYTIKDVELFEEMFVAECPTGSSLSHAFLEIIRSKQELLKLHFSAYEILAPLPQVNNPLSGTPEPQLKDFSNKVLWMKARAVWTLAQPSSIKYQEVEKVRQQQQTVQPSFIPRLRTAEAEDVPEIEAGLSDDTDGVAGFQELYGNFKELGFKGENDE